jgi:transcriptional regulator with XRE-family HTH domain
MSAQPDVLEPFGTLLRSRREAAALSRAELARKARLSPSTLEQLERGARRPSRTTLKRLLQVPELAWTPDERARLQERPLERPVRPLNALLTPHARLARDAATLPLLRTAPRTILRPAWAYLGPASAHAFRRFRARTLESQALASALSALAPQLRPHLRPRPLELLALGVGDGTHEVFLTQHLLDLSVPLQAVCLQDLSEPLLAHAYLLAVERLPPDIEVWALLADLEELSMHAEVLRAPDCQRLVLLLGGTLGELEDELRFLRYGLSFCTPGDLLILDVPLAAGVSDGEISEQEEDEAHRRLAELRPWLMTVLTPHIPDASLSWSLRLEVKESLPSSYAWCVDAALPGESTPRTFEVYRFKRYAPALLTQRLAVLGWQQLAAYPYGSPARAELQVYRCRERP